MTRTAVIMTGVYTYIYVYGYYYDGCTAVIMTRTAVIMYGCTRHADSRARAVRYLRSRYRTCPGYIGSGHQTGVI
jgi:hypothetical protein